MLVIHGLKNCDSCKKARAWLKDRGIAHRFHDLRGDGLSDTMIDHWLAEIPWQSLLNKRGTTWRGLPAAETDGLDAAQARALMLAHPALIKRPVFQTEGKIVIGFGAQEKAILESL